MKAEKKAAEKELKVKEQVEQKNETSNDAAHNILDEESLDPNVKITVVFIQVHN